MVGVPSAGRHRSGVVIFAITTAVIEGINVANAAALPGQLADADRQRPHDRPRPGDAPERYERRLQPLQPVRRRHPAHADRPDV